MTALEAVPAEAIGIGKGDRVGYLVNGRYESAIVLAVVEVV